MIYDYIGINNKDILLNSSIELNDKTKRIGFYDDAFFYNWNDLSTFFNIDSIDGIEGTNGNTCRYVHEAFLQQIIKNSCFGGECVKNPNPLGTLHLIANSISEFKTLNLTYLNDIYDSNVIDIWKEQIYNQENLGSIPMDKLYEGQTAYTYIQNHMGYRLVLKNSIFEYTNNYDILNVKLNLENVGFGNFNKTKNIKLMFVKEDGSVAFETLVGKYNGETNLNFSTNIDLNNGTYQVYLCIYSGEIDDPSYCVQFANEGSCWNDNLNANLIGNFVVNK